MKKTEWVYRGRTVSLKLETYKFEEGSKTVEIVHHKDVAVIIPIQQDGKILLIKQFRCAVQDTLIELPAGTLEEKEVPIDCAKRELQEETGFGAAKMEILGGFYTTPGFCDEYLHLFLAKELYPSKLKPDIDESIDLLPVTLKEAHKLIKENKIRDAKTIAGILLYSFMELGYA